MFGWQWLTDYLFCRWKKNIYISYILPRVDTAASSARLSAPGVGSGEAFNKPPKLTNEQRNRLENLRLPPHLATTFREVI